MHGEGSLSTQVPQSLGPIAIKHHSIGFSKRGINLVNLELNKNKDGLFSSQMKEIDGYDDTSGHFLNTIDN